MIVSDPEVIEHYGVKGMRWGVRKRRESGSTSSGREKVKTAAKASAAVLIAAGAGYAAYSVNKNANLKVSQIRSSSPKALKVGSETARRIAQQRMTFYQTAKAHNESVKLADAQLKEWNNKFNVPIPERSYLRR